MTPLLELVDLGLLPASSSKVFGRLQSVDSAQNRTLPLPGKKRVKEIKNHQLIDVILKTEVRQSPQILKRFTLMKDISSPLSSGMPFSCSLVAHPSLGCEANQYDSLKK